MADVLEMKDYFDPTVDTELVQAAREALHGVKYDTMVGRGLSGALVIPALAKALRKNWFIVRKPGEKSHSYEMGVGHLGHRWLFVDDFLVTGDTRAAVKDAVQKVALNREWPTKYVGTFTYKDSWFTGAPRFTSAEDEEIFG